MDIKPVPPLQPFTPLRKVEQRDSPPQEERDEGKKPEDGTHDQPPPAVDEYA